MPRAVLACSLLAAATMGGCTCGSKSPSQIARDAAAPAVPLPSASTAAIDAVAPPAANVFSAPIAAARMPDGTTVVAGFVADRGVVRVSGIGPDGSTAWSADALGGVTWAADAEVKLLPAADGTALVWRGPRGGRTARTLVLLGPRGEVRDRPIDVGAALCTTAEGVAWVDPPSHGPLRVRARRWAEAVPREVVAVSPERDASLVCGDHAVFVLGDGDDDLTTTSFVPGDVSASKPAIAVRDADFGEDDEREHYLYAVGDDLRIVRIGSSGAMAAREIPRSGAPTPWRKLRTSLSAADDVVAVDGDGAATFVVLTHDADDTCPVGSTAESVRALRIDHKSGAESEIDLAPADCDRSFGPFWIASAPVGSTVAWVARRTPVPSRGASIVGAWFRVLAEGAARAGHVEQPADALVDAGCTASGCALAALARPPDSDGTQPAPIRVVPYP